MPTPVGVARQCLTPDAARALDEAVSVARRRGHAQTTSLHAVSALLSFPTSSLLRDACCRARNSAYSPRLQFKALDLCLSVSLDRTPSSHPSTDPPVSNSLMAAIKRSQANQRRHPDTFNHLLFHHNHPNNLQQSQQPFSVSSVKVELQHLVLSILDDPVVSRVFSEAGFRSSEIKLAILRPLPHLFRYSRTRGPPVFLCNLPEQGRRGGIFGFPFSGGIVGGGGGGGNGDFGEEENFRSIGEVLVRSKGRNPILLGACAGDALMRFIEAVERRREGVVPLELAGLRVVCVGGDGGEGGVSGDKERLREAGAAAERRVGPGVVVNLGDLNGFVMKEKEQGEGDGDDDDGVVGELSKLLKIHSERIWVMGYARSYDLYLKFENRFPCVEKDWDLQLLPITSLQSLQRPRSSLMDSFVPFGGFFSSPSDLKGPLSGSLYCAPQCHQCGEQDVVAASKERLSTSAVDPYQTNLPPWLQITEFSATKGLNVKTKNDCVLLDGIPREPGPPHNDSDKIHHQHPHQLFPDANSCPTIVGFHCTDKNKEDAGSSKIGNKSYTEHINLNSQVPVDVQMMSTSQSSGPFPVIFKARQENYASKLTEIFQKADDPDSGDRRSCNLSNSSVCDGSEMSPTSVTSVTTDLGLGICSSPTSNKSKRPSGQYAMEPPKEMPTRFSSSFNLADGNVLKHPTKSSSCLSFDYGGQVDVRNPKELFNALFEVVSCQDEAIRAIIKTIVCSPTKKVEQHGENQWGGRWMNFVGPDRHGKKKIAVALAELLYRSRENFIFVDLSSEEMKGCNAKFRGKTTLDFIVGELCKNRSSVVFLENVDKADMVAQIGLSRAVKTGKLIDSHGREVSINNAIFVTSFSGYRNSSMQTEETSNYSEERILMAKGGAIMVKVEHMIGGDIRSHSSVANSLTDSIPNLVFINKRKLIGGDEFHDRNSISDVSKRAHTTSDWLLDLNLPAEENELQQQIDDDRNSEHVTTGNQNLWLQDLCDQVDETVVFKPYNFDALADRLLKVIRRNFNKILGSECALQIQSEVMDQLLAAAYVSDTESAVEKWVEQVLYGGFAQVQRSYNITASSVVKLITCPDEQASSEYLPPRIILD